MYTLNSIGNLYFKPDAPQYINQYKVEAGGKHNSIPNPDSTNLLINGRKTYSQIPLKQYYTTRSLSENNQFFGTERQTTN